MIHTVVVEAGNGKDLKGKAIPTHSGLHNFTQYLQKGFVAVGWLPQVDFTGKSSTEVVSLVESHMPVDPQLNESQKKAIQSDRIAAIRVINNILSVRPGDLIVVPASTHRIYGVGVALSSYKYQHGKMDPNGLGTNLRSHYVEVAWSEFSQNPAVDCKVGSGHYLERKAFEGLGCSKLWPGLGFTISISQGVASYLENSSFYSRVLAISTQVQANQPISLIPPTTLVVDENELDEEVSLPEPEKEYTGDAFSTIQDEKGRDIYVGNDGFEVPVDFTTFYARYPNYVRRWVQKRLFKNMVDDDVLDWEADLIMHLGWLPERSKAREPGYNGKPEGCKDVIESFNPKLQYGASGARFFNYIKHCLSNRFNTLYSKRKKNPLSAPGNYSIGTMNEDEGGVVDDEYLHSHSAGLAAVNSRQTSAVDQKVYLGQFFEYVKEHDADLVRVLQVMAHTGPYSEAMDELNMDEKTFQRAKSRLKVLSGCFANTTSIPKQRREYKKRSVVVSA